MANYAQVAAQVNAAVSAALGAGATLVKEDLSNIVDVGKQFPGLGDDRYDNYVRALTNVIGKELFDYRPYSSRFAGIMTDSWQYGSILRKVRVDLVEAEENPSWDLHAGQSYDPHVYRPPVAHEKIWNDRTTFMIPISFPYDQVNESWRSAEDVTRFVGMVTGMVRNSMELSLERLASKAVTNMIGETIYDAYGSGSLTAASHTRAVNLLYLYNQANSTSLTAADAMVDPNFIRFASAEMKKVAERLKAYTKIYNIEGVARHTSADYLKVMYHADFAASADAYLYSHDRHEQYVKLPEGDTVAFWQAPGDSFAFSVSSGINVETASHHNVNATGIIGIMFDKEAIVVANEKQPQTSAPNAVGRFTNYNYFHDAMYLNDFTENFIVFFIA